jgi:polysaccharide deacetylase 2 family uncharacterized protein YibQ
VLRGILLGSAWGLVLGGGFLAIMSLTYPATVQPPPETSAETTEVATPPATTEDPPTVLPPPLSAPDRHDAADVARPDPVSPRRLATDDLSPGPAPVLSQPEAQLGSAPTGEGTSPAGPAPDTAVLPSPQAMPPVAPAPEAEPQIATTPAAPPRAEPGEEVTGFPMGDLTETTVAPEAAPAPQSPQQAQAAPDDTVAPGAAGVPGPTASDTLSAATGDGSAPATSSGGAEDTVAEQAPTATADAAPDRAPSADPALPSAPPEATVTTEEAAALPAGSSGTSTPVETPETGGATIQTAEPAAPADAPLTAETTAPTSAVPSGASTPAEPPETGGATVQTAEPAAPSDAPLPAETTVPTPTAPSGTPTPVETVEAGDTGARPVDPTGPAARPEDPASVTAEAPSDTVREPVAPQSSSEAGAETAIAALPDAPTQDGAEPSATPPSDRPTTAPEDMPEPVAKPARPAPPIVAMPGQPGIRLTEDAPATDAPPPVETDKSPQPDPDLPPIDRYAEPFENPEGRPILSIVLLDSARDGAVAPMPARFPYPVSIAIPAEAPDAADRMRRYRAAGYEVLALVDLPQGATPADIETRAPAWFEAVPDAVAIMERPPKSLQSDRANGEELADVLAASGHGLLLFPDGLDTTRKLAARRGVPAATVFRDLDAAGQGEAVIRRFLDNAAFKAGMEGAVILVARLRPETLEALLVWGLADRASRVALAPVSAALKAAAP